MTHGRSQASVLRRYGAAGLRGALGMGLLYGYFALVQWLSAVIPQPWAGILILLIAGAIIGVIAEIIRGRSRE